jgi:ATP-binding cassette subfamily B protein
MGRPRLAGGVRFENVSFSYDGAGPVLRDIDLEVKPGQCVAILGATGAGKSSLMSLIPRFYDPTGGCVRVDGIDVRTLRLDDLRRGIGIVFQESFLFSNTVAANIAFGHPDATQAQIEKAARVAAAHEFILRLPQGYDTVLGESGNTLSGGQRQRLAIARAVLLEPAILLLDDPTAAIDSETEHEIFTALENAIAGRTTFIVAHRLSTLRRADFILVMENGRIVQRGTHAELMNVPGPYLRVADLQLVNRDDASALLREKEGRL